MKGDRIRTCTFILSLIIHACFLPLFNISYPKPEKKMIVEMVSETKPLSSTIETKPLPVIKEIMPKPQFQPKKEILSTQEPLSPESEPKQIIQSEPEPKQIIQPEPEPEQVIQPEPVMEELEKKEEIVRDVTPIPDIPLLSKREDKTGKIKGDFLQLVRKKIEQAKHYPKWAREKRLEGKVWIEFIIEKGGDVNEIRIIEGSGNWLLDKDAVSTIKRASPFQQLPQELGKDSLKITIPIVYKLIN